MRIEPKCFKRGCVYFATIKNQKYKVGKVNGKEYIDTEVSPKCIAYPDGIPEEIAYGDDLHNKLRGDEAEPVKFEKG